MNITDLRTRLESLYDQATLAKQPSELTGSLSNSLRIARQCEARADCVHSNCTEETRVVGRRLKVTTCNTCGTIVGTEEV